MGSYQRCMEPGPEPLRVQSNMVRRGLRPKTVMIQMAALRFLFLKVLKRRYSRDDLPLPKTLKRQIPVVLSREDVARLIACACTCVTVPS